MRLPLYQDECETYQADTCRGLIEGVTAGRVRVEALVHGHYPGRPLPRGTLPGVKSVGFWDAVADQDWGLDWHRNEGIELTFLESGRIEFAVDRRHVELQPHDLTVTRPWQAHRVGDPHVTAGRLHWLILDVNVRRPHQPWRWPAWLVLTPADRDELTRFLRHNEEPVWPATPKLAACFREIAHAVESDERGRNVSRLTVCLNDLFLLLLDLFRAHPVPLDRSLTSTQRTVQLFWQELQGRREHLALEWTVARMAKRCGLGVTRFTQLSKELTNMPPVQHLNRCRLKAAAELLRDRPELSITEVAFECGFSSAQYFTTLFRRAFAATPKRYRLDGASGVE